MALVVAGCLIQRAGLLKKCSNLQELCEVRTSVYTVLYTVNELMWLLIPGLEKSAGCYFPPSGQHRHVSVCDSG